MKRNIFLYGDLAEKYGKKFKFAVKSIGEALRLLDANFPGFRKDIKAEEEYIVVVGDVKKGEGLDNETVFLEFQNGDFHICPKIAGAKSMFGSIATAVLGVALMVASYWVPPAGAFGLKLLSSSLVFNVGLALFATGILGMLTPTQQGVGYGDRENPDDRPSFLYDGPINTVEQGGAIPIIYGKMMVGSTLISSALDVEDT